MFSSPSKQAGQAASASQGISQQTIDQAENYNAQQQGQERSAIAGLGDNPYIAAADQLAQTPPKITPTAANTSTFATPGPAGTTTPGAARTA
jgi:hypothetical protein